ncbi:MAG TPA: YciI family protein, partial [bacterium]|nr:YciI family protein [bacterium]
MSYFLYKLIAPRPTFAQDMTAAEAKLMAEHGVYWKDLADRGIALLFGPVLDPKGSWGLAVVETKNEAEVRAIGRNDPAIKS